MLVEDRTVQGQGLTTSMKIGKSRVHLEFLKDPTTKRSKAPLVLPQPYLGGSIPPHQMSHQQPPMEVLSTCSSPALSGSLLRPVANALNGCWSRFFEFLVTTLTPCYRSFALLLRDYLVGHEFTRGACPTSGRTVKAASIGTRLDGNGACQRRVRTSHV